MSRNNNENFAHSSRSWIEIDSAAFYHNIGIIESLTHNSSLALSFKAHAHGHGLLAMSHLAQQDNRISSLHVDNQETATTLHDNGITKTIVIDNHLHSAAECTTWHYGIYNAQNSDYSAFQPGHSLRPLLTWKTKIMRLKHCAQNVSVGYARSFITKRPTALGILPIGYADGLPRLLSNKGSVLTKGGFAPIVGLISMNLLAIDVTDIENACQNDEVTIIGPENLMHMAQSASCTPMELVSRLHYDIPRFIVPEFFDKTYAQPHLQNARFF
jgi:alanine racemase